MLEDSIVQERSFTNADYCNVALLSHLNMTVNDLNSVKKFRSLVKKSDLTQFLYYV